MTKESVFRVETEDGVYESVAEPEVTDNMVILKNCHEPSEGYHGPDYELVMIPLTRVTRITKDK